MKIREAFSKRKKLNPHSIVPFEAFQTFHIRNTKERLANEAVIILLGET